MSLPQILIVDDDAGIRGLLATLAAHNGWLSDFADNGHSAIEKLRRTEYSAVLLDLMLPARTGFEVLQFLKAERPHVLRRCIVLTAASDVTLRHFDRSVARCVIRKPFELNALIAELRDCIGARTESTAPSPVETPRLTAARAAR